MGVGEKARERGVHVFHQLMDALELEMRGDVQQTLAVQGMLDLMVSAEAALVHDALAPGQQDL